MSTTNSTVRYLPVVGFPGYRVGDDGSVWSCWKLRGTGYARGTIAYMSDTWARLTPIPDKDGYLRVGIGHGKNRRPRPIHILILESFLCPRPTGLVVCHRDGNKLNNSLSNLRWNTVSENNYDKERHGTGHSGVRNIKCKLTEEQVRTIRTDYESKMKNQVQLAAEYRVNQTTISAIVRRKIWDHI